jgi:prepilin-type N-terminal cleavage/methylation domain-containing protein
MKGRIMKIMKKSSAGFTLIEVIASLVLMGIVGLVAAMGLVQGIKAYALTKTSSETVQQAEYALNRIKLEFMDMDTVTAAGADTITFTSDKTSRPNNPPQGTSYTFTRIGPPTNAINLTVTPPGGTGVPLITGLGTYGAGTSLFTYLDNSGGAWVSTNGFGDGNNISQCYNPAINPSLSHCCASSLHSITINLIIARSDGGGDLTLTTSVNPRGNECTDGPEAAAGAQ